MKTICESCRTWSDLMARSNPDKPGEMVAMCLNALSPNYQQWTSTNDTCERQQAGEPVDAFPLRRA
jgi:hypothetical protein